MSHKDTRVVLFAGTLVLLGAALAQAEIMYKSAERAIYGEGTQLDAIEQLTTGMEPFTSDMLNSGYVRDDQNSIVGSVSSFASQSSTLSDNQIRGLARGSGFGSGGAEGIGRSSMLVEFEIDQSMRFTLTGQLRLAPHGGQISINDSEAYIRLTGPEGIAIEVVMNEDNLPDVLGLIDFSGDERISDVFPSGNYTLEAFAEGHGSDGTTRCVDFDFTLTALNAVAVPEPDMAIVFVLAALGLIASKKRR